MDVKKGYRIELVKVKPQYKERVGDVGTVMTNPRLDDNGVEFVTVDIDRDIEGHMASGCELGHGIHLEEGYFKQQNLTKEED